MSGSQVDVQTGSGWVTLQPGPHLDAEDKQFLVGSPKEVEDVVMHHRSKFVAGPVQQAETSELLTQGGLHPGSPRYASQDPHTFFHQQDAAAAAGQQQQQSGGGNGGGTHNGGSPDPYFEMASHMPHGRPSQEKQEGDEYVYGRAADSLDFASEEMDAE